MVSYYNYPSYNDKAYQVSYPKWIRGDQLGSRYVYDKGKYPKKYKTLDYDGGYFKKHFKSYKKDNRLYTFEKYLTDEELDNLDRYIEYDSLNKFIKGYRKEAIKPDRNDMWYSIPSYQYSQTHSPEIWAIERHRHRRGHTRTYYSYRSYTDSELRNLYPGLEDREYHDDIQSLLSLASVREARERNLFSRPTYANEDVLRYLFYTGSLDMNLYLRSNGKKLFINDPIIQRDLKVVQKVQKKLGMKNTINDIVDFGYPSTADIQVGLPPHPTTQKSDDILHDLDISRKLDYKVKDAAKGNGRSEVIPANRVAERFFKNNPLIYRLINQKHGNKDVLI